MKSRIHGNNKEHDKERREFEKLLAAADKGDAEAQLKLASCFFFGTGTDKDPDKAIEWLDKSYERGNMQALEFWGKQSDIGDEVEKAIKTNPRGKFLLGSCYYMGIGKEKDDEKAAELFEEAILSGDVKATRARVASYLDGRCTTGMNDKRCFDLISDAADKGDKTAKIILGRMCFEGRCTEKDPQKAISILNEVSDDHRAQYSLAIMYLDADSEVFSMREGIKFLKSSAENGFASAQLELGRCYYSGNGVDQDKELALHWFKKAADQNDDEALYNMGARYLYGDLVDKDESKAILYFERAVRLNHSYSKLALGRCLTMGGEEKDKKRGIDLLEEASLDGLAEAKVLLAVNYMDGLFTPEDKGKAVRYLNEAAVENSAGAKFLLGMCCLEGIVEKKSVDRAFELFEEVEDIYPEAKHELGLCLEFGKGNIAENKTAAFIKYRDAAAADHVPAMNKLGEFNENGWNEENEINKTEAKIWYQKAADAGDTGGLYNLARMFEGEKDYENAWLNYGLAKESGHKNAAERFDTLDVLIKETGKKEKLEKELEQKKKEIDTINKEIESNKNTFQRFYDNHLDMANAVKSGDLGELFLLLENQREIVFSIVDQIGRDAGMLGDKASDKERQEFLLRSESNINRALHSAPSSEKAVNEAEDLLKNHFKDCWGSFMHESRTSLTSSWASWKLFKGLNDNKFDFRGVVICATGALEHELKTVLFDKFKIYANKLFHIYDPSAFYKVNDRAKFVGLDSMIFNDHNDKPIIGDENEKRDFIEKLGWLFKEDFSLGSCRFMCAGTFSFLFPSSRGKRKDMISLEHSEQKCFENLRESYLSTIIGDRFRSKTNFYTECFTKAIFGKSGRTIKSGHIKEYDDNSLIAKIEHIAEEFRNISAHGAKVKKNVAERCCKMIIGDPENNSDVKDTIFYQLFDLLKKTR